MTSSRLDKWLFCARLCRTREAAQAAIAAGKVRVNGVRVEKSGRNVRLGDVLTLALGNQVRVVTVLALAERRAASPAAQALYESFPI
ncbi:MAG: RNA-binding S4 domain-containing protein [Alphaproteobacteria bacterium]|nr:RNA-binding S4 domain-containing protein [Alphaproteobacteria bacterium]